MPSGSLRCLLANIAGFFDDDGYYAYFWSASESYGSLAYYMDLYYSYEDANLSFNFVNNAFSVRCVENSK